MTKGKRLWLVLLANVSMVLALAIVGLISRSLGVLGAGGDYLGDAAGVALALIALRYNRHGTENPHASSLPALANGHSRAERGTMSDRAVHGQRGGDADAVGRPSRDLRSLSDRGRRVLIETNPYT